MLPQINKPIRFFGKNLISAYFAAILNALKERTLYESKYRCIV